METKLKKREKKGEGKIKSRRGKEKGGGRGKRF